MHNHDVLVLGGGHAGAEAAAMAARRGARVMLLTQQLETIGQMSCNPAIGGIAKGTVAREVDALGGIMGRATDRAMLQFRMLNQSKGPAVASPRAQCDRALYRSAVRHLLETVPSKHPIHLVQGMAVHFLLQGDRVTGVVTSDGRRFEARAVVITTGTFLRGQIHVGTHLTIPAGRAGEPPAIEISQHLAALGLVVERFKTGTPPRIDGRTVDFSELQRQDGDPAPYWFSYHERARHPDPVPSWLTWAGEPVKELVRRHIADSALYGGAISGAGPRYCPSVEDKIVKFPDAPRHQVFLEPEGRDTAELYVGGLSTSLPPDVQLAMLRLVPGLENVEMTRPGYAIEYDYLPPTQCDATLAIRGVPGLYSAGQINGTTGYEEAAGQGVVAGLNAAASALDLEPVRLGRDEAYCGVLVDDLVTRGVDEPYRLFTSRAEHRLLLRQDNALRRLAPLATKLGLWTDDERRAAEARLEAEEAVHKLAVDTLISPAEAAPLLGAAASDPLFEPVRVVELVKRPGVPLAAALSAAGVEVDSEHAEWAGIEIRYAGYLVRERAAADRLRRLEGSPLPDDLEYAGFEQLSIEARHKLAAVRPTTIAQAGRIPGVSPADLQHLLIAAMRRTPGVSRGTPA
jgi:tRNA uridine 5-carboxymethylaminomethyl modification enzyme